MIDYVVDFRGLQEQIQKLQASDEIVDRRLGEGMEKSVAIVAANIQPLVPRLTGQLADSIGGRVRHLSPGAVDGIVSSSLAGEIYPAVVEFGRKPGSKMPPPDAFGGGSVGFVIARAIGRRGIPGVRYMKRGWEKSRAGVLVNFATALELIAQDLAVGGG